LTPDPDPRYKRITMTTTEFTALATRTLQTLGARDAAANVRPRSVRAHLAATRERALYAGDTSVLVAIDALPAPTAAAAYIDGTIFSAP
jgi:hypothetical protein